jgi:hypothetical protein
MSWPFAQFRRSEKPFVRPWALATPIAVFLFCLPLLRPLHHPGQVSGDEELRLSTVASLVENHPGLDASLAARLALDEQTISPQSHLISVRGHIYSDQPPMLAFLLSGPYWILHKFGYRLRDNSVLVPYLLTLIGATLPAAAAGGLAYRMGRIFELRRPWRCGLAAAVVFASGLISYAVVLNAQVPAAVLVLAAMGCLVHLAASGDPAHGGGWLIVAGLCAALAATIDPWATVFFVLLMLVICVMRLRPALRLGGVILYLLGAAPPILLHGMLTVHITGDMLPGSMHPELAATRYKRMEDISNPDLNPAPESTDAADIPDDADITAPQGFWQNSFRAIGHFIWGLIGEHGLLVHFPIVVLGLAGMFAVMHRHWPATTKVLAAISAVSMLIALIAYAAGGRGTSTTADYANRWLIVFAPILFFWAGAWLRRTHRPPVWWIACSLLAFSVIVSLIGATDPMPRAGYSRYTVAAALHNIFYPTPATSTTAWADRP